MVAGASILRFVVLGGVFRSSVGSLDFGNAFANVPGEFVASNSWMLSLTLMSRPVL